MTTREAVAVLHPTREQVRDALLMLAAEDQTDPDNRTIVGALITGDRTAWGDLVTAVALRSAVLHGDVCPHAITPGAPERWAVDEAYEALTVDIAGTLLRLVPDCDMNGSASGASPTNEAAAGGWSGQGYPEHGDFVRPRPSGNTHIVQTVTPYNSRHARVVLACGTAWSTEVLDPSDGDLPRQCQRCWDLLS